MNDMFSVITGMSMHAYYVASFICLISIPGRMMIRALHKKAPI